MGCLFVLVLAGVSTAMISIFGYSLLLMAVLGSLWLAALVYSAICCGIPPEAGFNRAIERDPVY